MNFYKYTVDDLRQRYKCKSDSELAALLGCSKGTVSLWRSNGVPVGYQRLLNVETYTPASRKNAPITA